MQPPPKAMKEVQQLTGHILFELTRHNAALRCFFSLSSNKCLLLFRAWKNPRGFVLADECQIIFDSSKINLSILLQLTFLDLSDSLSLYSTTTISDVTLSQLGKNPVSKNPCTMKGCVGEHINDRTLAFNIQLVLHNIFNTTIEYLTKIENCD